MSTRDGKTEMVIQKWKVILDDSTHEIEYRFSTFSGKTVLVVDGDAFTVRGKPFGIGAARREPVIVGDCQAVLDVAKNGKAKLLVRDATEVIEIK